MTRRELRHTLALPVLAATLVCVVLSLPALAQPGQSQGRSQQDKSTHEQSAKKGDADKNQRGNSKSRGEKRDRGRSDEHYGTPDDGYNNSSKAQSLSPQQAAQRARSQYGGQVLKVQPAGDGYQVRLLQEDGRVVTVPIGD
jgi:flagellum-specific peptidoglycan hydrolase FlgJ